MLHLGLGCDGTAPSTFLFLGAHCDDIEIGCGGTVLALRRKYPEARFHWHTFCSNDVRRKEHQASARSFLGTDEHATTETFRDGFLPYVGGDVKDCFESLKKRIQPDVIFTHYRDDRHQDHRLVCELTWNTFRNHLVLEYEIPKWDGDLGIPNTFVELTPRDLDQKVAFLHEAYASQRERQWFDADTIKGLARLRGIEANAADRYAEAFYCRKATIAT